MADLVLDADALGRVRANLARIADLLERPGRQLTALDGSAAGPPRLRARVDDFAEEWSYGIGQLRKLAGTAVQALDEVQATFANVDAALTRALAPAADRGSTPR